MAVTNGHGGIGIANLPNQVRSSQLATRSPGLMRLPLDSDTRLVRPLMKHEQLGTTAAVLYGS